MSEQTSLIQLAPDVLYQDLEDEAVFLNMNDNHYYGLDVTGTRMWRLLSEHDDLESVIKQMLKEFDTDEATLRRDVAGLIEKLTQAGLIVTG
jgi:hypothetical protein